jgi:Domain of unknown function (DUF1844)
MNDSTERFGGERDQAELDQAEAMRQLQHELATAPPIEVIAQAVAHLATLAYVRLGVPPQENQPYQDLEAARVLIDALGGLLGAVEGRLGPGAEELYQALAALRMTYASVSGQPAGEGAGGQGPEPARPAAEERPRRPSGLWVPGQD